MIVLRDKVFFQSAATGEYYTGDELLKKAREIRAEHRNGTVKWANSGKPSTRELSRDASIRYAYVKKNTENGSLKGAAYLQKKGLIESFKPSKDGKRIEELVHRDPKPKSVKKFLGLIKKIKK